MTLPPLPPSLDSEYTVESCLRRSDKRATLLLRDRLSRRFAVLRISPQASGEAENEYTMLSLFSSPGIPTAYRCFHEDGQSYMLREYIEGQVLSDLLLEKKHFSEAEAVSLVRSLCHILAQAHAHEPPIVHRDIKAENLILTPEGRLVLIDWGIARFFEPGMKRDTQVLGTPAVAPPEQFGYCQTDPRSDVYAIGMLLRTLLGEDQPGVRICPPLDHILCRCLQFSPDARYADAAHLEKMLAVYSRSAAFRRIISCAAVAAAAAGIIGLLVISAVRFLPSRATSSSISASSVSSGTQLISGAQPSAPYVFQSPALEAAVREMLGKPEGELTLGDLSAIQTLILCGDEVYAGFDQLTPRGKSLTADGAPVTARGQVDTLADLPYMTNLRTLALCSQQITDLSPLEGLPLQHLALHDNAIRDVSPLASCAYLQTLYIGCNPVSDLSPLAACPYLSQLNADDTALTSCDSLTGMQALSFLSLYGCTQLGDIEALTRLPELSALRLNPVSSDQLDSLSRLPVIRDLYLWNVEGLTSLEPLSPLSSLNFLFIDSPMLASLDGIDAFGQLTSLTLFNTTVSDLSPLSQAFSLMHLSIPGVSAHDWTPLADMPRLVSVRCSSASLGAIRALGLKISVDIWQP